ncbi:MAG: NUDIX hydrolase [Candidatus Nealsonbacteria bacterium CG23_combo_of_CG06-09_8_20_14_all_36_12]|uniref:NUDIX hydrolase n=2 Tax=Candidatus Nealsoniibacteriota TaxID=1817911 RepID=A0A2H0TKV1_9BACT|nr:MAG: NUDIX hydrolase [Candidatus Nealsonbacteria bacterium CG23_combo_of_CG06-09_8_20_14_all_36_12]PIR72784.1 MAG: NUDIX hydrolase [Candidatus Nealsonbacteria bacterium CG10_big_fil_rev_8_21_14_0_10_36_23]
MKILKKKVIYKGKYLRAVEKEYLTKTGKRGIWECIERPAGVLIFPLTKNKEVILEKIFRIPINSYSIELPAGALDRKNENPKETAKRELLEETGYLAKKLIPVFKWQLSPWVASSLGILFFAPDVEFVGKKGGEDVEEIEVIKVPLKNLEKFLLENLKKTKVEISIFGALAILREKRLI